MTHRHLVGFCFVSVPGLRDSFHSEFTSGHNTLHLSVDTLLRTGTFSSEFVYNHGSHFYFFRIQYLDYFPKH